MGVNQDQTKGTDLVGAADQLEDVHLRVWFTIVCEEGVEVGDGWEGAVLVGHTVQVPEDGYERVLLPHSLW